MVKTYCIVDILHLRLLGGQDEVVSPDRDFHSMHWLHSKYLRGLMNARRELH